jgi:hypothetical protein
MYLKAYLEEAHTAYVDEAKSSQLDIAVLGYQ